MAGLQEKPLPLEKRLQLSPKMLLCPTYSNSGKEGEVRGIVMVLTQYHTCEYTQKWCRQDSENVVNRNIMPLTSIANSFIPQQKNSSKAVPR